MAFTGICALGKGKHRVRTPEGEFRGDIGTQSQESSLGADFFGVFFRREGCPLRGPSGGVGGAFAKGRAPNTGKVRQNSRYSLKGAASAKRETGTKNPARVRSGTEAVR